MGVSALLLDHGRFTFQEIVLESGSNISCGQCLPCFLLHLLLCYIINQQINFILRNINSLFEMSDIFVNHSPMLAFSLCLVKIVTAVNLELSFVK